MFSRKKLGQLLRKFVCFVLFSQEPVPERKKVSQIRTRPIKLFPGYEHVFPHCNAPFPLDYFHPRRTSQGLKKQLTSTLSQRKGQVPQPSITFSCQARGGVCVVWGAQLWCGGLWCWGVSVVWGVCGVWWGGRHVRDFIRPIRLTVALGLKNIFRQNCGF